MRVLERRDGDADQILQVFRFLATATIDDGVRRIRIAIVPNQQVFLTMRTSTLAGLAKRAVLLLLCAAAFVVFSDTASASCGDYLHHRGMVPEAVDSGDQTAPAFPTPCRGPGCRQSSPPLAPVPAPPSLERTSDHLVVVLHNDSQPPALSARQQLFIAAHELDGYAIRLERPPR